ncbi:MAG: glycosyltransferase [Geminocystis sp.]|nr:glycosyltransferase [Geminocystis sp.]MCS7147581.1 glycosyltransferase [Geminocystis sp.]MDW8115274.1 glycosyltransferase [Geminocystis sp.]MDW8464541.1 glycosyltransferase [Geminocystis sp.]
MRNVLRNILLVSHSDFPTNSAVHVHHFANELVKMGLDCVVAVPKDKNSIHSLNRTNLYKVTQYNEYQTITDFFDNKQPPDLVHCWTPREHVRIYCKQLSQHYSFRLVVHLEDNEEAVTARLLQNPSSQWEATEGRKMSSCLSHPQHSKEFLRHANGVTVIIDTLQQLIPYPLPRLTVYPGVDTSQFYPRRKNSQLLSHFSIPPHATIICYTGNVYATNVAEVRSLYLAVGKRNREGKPTYLIRTGIDYTPLLTPQEDWIRKYLIELGWVEREKIPEILSLADVLIQPGKSDEFNDYRFPSKIPEFLAMGIPVILPDTNIAKFLTHGENALILPVVNEETIPPAIDLLLNNPSLRQRLIKGGLHFVYNYLNWQKNTRQLLDFYQSLFPDNKKFIPLENSLYHSQKCHESHPSQERQLPLYSLKLGNLRQKLQIFSIFSRRNYSDC